MLLDLPERPQERVYYAAIGLAALVRFVNLGFKDLQAWDEALYAIRSEGILRFGGWLDQTPFAIDGLYSSLHPPLYVWFTSLAFELFGVNEFAARFFSAVFGGLTLFVVYGIGKKLANRHVGLLAAVLFGLHPFTTFYARQGQFDTTLVFFLALSVYFLLKNLDHPTRFNAILAGLCTGAALMTKQYVGLGIPVTYAVWILVSTSNVKRKHWEGFVLILLAAGLVAIPWHCYMTIVHGQGDIFFLLKASSLWERTVSGVEGNVKPLEGFYFVNQLVVLFPVGIVWFAYGLWRTIRVRHAPWLLITLWFLVFFLVFSVMRTKLAVYSLPMLVPAALCAAQQLWKTMNGEHSRRLVGMLMAGTFIAVIWSSSQEWRNLTKVLFRSLAAFQLPDLQALSSAWLMICLISVSVIVIILLVRSGVLDRLRVHLITLVAAPLLAWSVYTVVHLDATGYNDGGKAMADFIHHEGYDRLVVAGYERNPQLTFYLRGVDIGWREDIQFRRIIPPKGREEFRSWLLNETSHEPPSSLLVIEKDKFVRYEVINPFEIVPPDFELVFETRRYACFQRAKRANVVRRSPYGPKAWGSPVLRVEDRNMPR